MAHVCACEHCSDLELPAEQLGPGHVSLNRFEKVVRDGEHVYAVQRAHVFVDGVQTMSAFEALPGKDGYVAEYAEDDQGKKHFCQNCWDGPDKRYGFSETGELVELNRPAGLCWQRRNGAVQVRFDNLVFG